MRAYRLDRPLWPPGPALKFSCPCVRLRAPCTRISASTTLLDCVDWLGQILLHAAGVTSSGGPEPMDPLTVVPRRCALTVGRYHAYQQSRQAIPFTQQSAHGV